MDNQNTTSQISNNEKSLPAKVKKRRSVPLRGLVLLLIALVLIGGAGYLAYDRGFKRFATDVAELQGNKDWQQSQLDELNGFKDYATGQIDSLNNQLAVGYEYYDEEFTYPQPDVTIEGTSTFTSDQLTDPSHKLVLIDVLVKNNQQEDVYFSSSELKLKDTNDYEYNAYYPYDSGYIALPDGKSMTEYMTLKPGEQTRGTFVYLLTRNVDNLVLSNVSSGKVLETIEL